MIIKGLLESQQQEESKTTTNIDLRIIVIFSTIFASVIYWKITEFSLNPIYTRMPEIESFFPSYSSVSNLLNPIVFILGGIILAIIYSFVKSSSLLKIIIGFSIFAFSIVVILLCQRSAISTTFIATILFAMFLQAISELFISPVVFSVICQYGPTKFNATLIGAFSGLSSLFSYTTSYLIGHTGEYETTISLLISICVVVFFAAIFFVFYLLIRKNNTVN